MPTDVDAGATAPKRGPIRGPQNFVSGVALIALALFAVYLVGDLPQGTLRAMGPAMLPRWLAIGVGLCGALLLVIGLVRDGDGLEKWTFRGPVFVALGIVAFGLTDRKSTRLNSSHANISYAVFCLKKKKKNHRTVCRQQQKNNKRQKS